MYTNAINPKLKLLLKNFQLSDDIAFRFSQQSWPAWPLTTEKFVGWLNEIDEKEEVVNLFMDYETFGEHQWPETGIFEFMRALPEKVMSNTNFSFNTPSELSNHLQAIAPIHVPYPISWADEERDLTAWLGNELQDEAFDTLYALEDKVNKCTEGQIRKDWEYLQTSDHFYYMCTKWFSDGDVHKYFNPYGTPYEAFINYMNVLSDFIIRVDEAILGQSKQNTVVKEVKPKAVKAKQPKEKNDKPQSESYKFKDLAKVPKQKLKSALANMDAETLLYALHGADSNLKDRVLSNISIKTLSDYELLLEEVIEVEENKIKNAKRKIIKALKSN
jgi:alpha-amylase